MKLFESQVNTLSKLYMCESEDLSSLKQAIIDREEFIDSEVIGSSIGTDYVVSVFDKIVIVFTADNTPFLIEREDLSAEESALIEELYKVLQIYVADEEDEIEVVEDPEINPEDDDIAPEGEETHEDTPEEGEEE